MKPASIARWLRQRSLRFWLLATASAALALTALEPALPLPRESYSALFVLDITQSMNTPDAGGAGEPATRLAAAKAGIRTAIAELPCGSEAGIAVFTEYRSFLLLAPVEVCDGYAELLSTLERLDWRMAWAGASQISKGIHFALELARALEPRPAVVFVTDGHEAPATDSELRQPLDNSRNTVPGLIVGVGGDALSPIPKFDMDGNDLGFWAEEEVVSQSVPAAGVGNLDADARAAAERRVRRSTEHLSSLKETYLRGLAAEAGLKYLRLDSPGALVAALRQPDFARRKSVSTDLRWVAAAAALLALALAHAPAARGRMVERISSRT